MAPKRGASKETTEISTGEVVEEVPFDSLVYAGTHLFIEKGSKLTWQQFQKKKQQ